MKLTGADIGTYDSTGTVIQQLGAGALQPSRDSMFKLCVVYVKVLG